MADIKDSARGLLGGGGGGGGEGGGGASRAAPPTRVSDIRGLNEDYIRYGCDNDHVTILLHSFVPT